ncbi:MAG: GGDEF domain-containing protein [Actinobacteria bacterium]|nr:GGDEF domain-containing protein [Actinomycetota bacterium]
MDDRRDRPSFEAAAYAAPDAPTGDGHGALTAQAAWHTSAVLFAATGLACLAQVATGAFGDAVENPGVVAAAAVVALLLAGIWWILGARSAGERWLHAGQLTSYALLTIVLAQAPTLASHLSVAYLLPLIFAALFLSSRSLIFYIAVSVAFIVFSSVAYAGESISVLPAAMTIAALVSTAGLTFYVRLQLDSIGRQSARLSGRDALTGLPNLRPLYERLEVMINRAARDDGSLSVVMLDLEGFKRVNDQYSHSVGDQTLRAVAAAMMTTARRSELVARRGGDEFAIVTDTADPVQIEALIERLATAIADARYAMLPDAPTGVTAGWAAYEEGDDIGRLLSRADHALNEAKAAARIQRGSWRARRLGEDFEPGPGS